jgi:hypothetical protein
MSKEFNCESERPDQTKKLGKDLTCLEFNCYQTIFQNGINPVNSDNVYESVYGHKDSYYGRKCIWNVINHIRTKLGVEAIITTDKGYVARKAVINSLVEKRKSGLPLTAYQKEINLLNIE